MRARASSSTIGAMFLHPEMLLEIARQRIEDLLAEAQSHRVAHMAAEGQTNREVAQALFVSPKTVEVHLSSVYRKLGISSRAQLPVALAEPASAHP